MDSCIILWDMEPKLSHKKLNWATSPFRETANLQASWTAQIGPFYTNSDSKGPSNGTVAQSRFL